MLSLMLIVGICFFPFPFQDELIETMIAVNEGVANNFIPFHTITVLFKDAIAYKRYGVICYIPTKSETRNRYNPYKYWSCGGLFFPSSLAKI
jgi:hypothetical protein